MDKIWLKSYDPGVPETINPDEFHDLNEMFRKCFLEYAKQPCLVSTDTILSYEQVDSLSCILAGYLQNELGLTKGMRLAILMPSIIQNPIVMLAALRLGLIIVNIPYMLSSDDIHKVINLTEPECIVVYEPFVSNLEPALVGTTVKHVILTELDDLLASIKRTLIQYVLGSKKKSNAAKIPGAISFGKIIQTKHTNELKPVVVEPNDTAFLQFTGARDQAFPKCVELSHRNIIANTLQILAAFKSYFDSNPEKTILQLIPLFRSGTLVHLFSAFRKGYECILSENPKDVATVVAESKQRPFSNLAGLEVYFELYLRDTAFCDLDFSKLRLTLGGGIISEQTATRWKVLTDTMIVKVYAVTETVAVTCSNPLNALDYRNSVGLPVPSCEIKVCDPSGNELPLNKRGELWIRGPHVMKGYWRDPDKTRQVLTQDGWLKTGDIVVVDEQGYVIMIDRLADIIEHAGQFTYSIDIENIIGTVPGVDESAVVCIKQPKGDTTIKAYVIRKDPTLTEDTIMQLCRELLPVFCPHEIIFVDSLPRASVGYVMKRSLRERG